MALTLTEVRRMPEERRLRLTWTDGHVAEYDYDYLRGWCPCAGCQGHSGFKIRYQPPGLLPFEPLGTFSRMHPNAVRVNC